MELDKYNCNENELVASICKKSFYDFVQMFWSEIIQEKPVWNWHIQYLCNQLQYVAERVFQNKRKKYDLIINISPGSTKSSIASVMFPAWAWTRMQSARFICASHGYPLALDLSRRSRDICQSDKYKKIFPDIKLREDQNTKGEFHTTKGGMRYAIGTGGSVIGRHGHFILVDDPIDPSAALSETDMKTVNQWMSETLPTRKVDKKIAVTVLIMQRLHENDPTGMMLEKVEDVKGRRIKHICLPAKVESLEDTTLTPKSLYKHYTNGLMDPVRLGDKVLDDARVDLGEYGYAGQFLQSPNPLGGGMFKVGRIKQDTCPSIFKKIVRYWDKAGTIDGGCFTVGLKMGVDSLGRFWILDINRGQWDSSKREYTMLQTAQNDGFPVHIGLEQEPGSGGKESAENSVRNLAGFRVVVDRPVGNKMLRADPFAVQVNNGNVYIDTFLYKTKMMRDYRKELRTFPHGKFKDQVDATSGAFSMLTKRRIRVGGMQ